MEQRLSVFGRTAGNVLSFSTREGVAPEPERHENDYLPQWTREVIVSTLANFVESVSSSDWPRVDVYGIIRPYIWKVLDRAPPGSPQGGAFAYYFPTVFTQCEWWQCYDILEEILIQVESRHGIPELEGLGNHLDAALATDGIAWTIKGTEVARRIPAQASEAIQAAHMLLADDKFRGPDEQFTKAVGHLNKRPEADEENCVKDAVGAVEGVANILVGVEGVQLNTLLGQQPLRSNIHGSIRAAMDKVYAYRGSAPGAAHALVGDPTIDGADALWVLTVSAATIGYLVDKLSD